MAAVLDAPAIPVRIEDLPARRGAQGPVVRPAQPGAPERVPNRVRGADLNPMTIHGHAAPIRLQAPHHRRDHKARDHTEHGEAPPQ
jgi:hypothetical protein